MVYHQVQKAREKVAVMEGKLEEQAAEFSRFKETRLVGSIGRK